MITKSEPKPVSTHRFPALSSTTLGVMGVALVMVLISPGAVQAGDLTYQPNNPSFGGFSGNSSHFYQGAEISNNFKRKKERRDKMLSDLNNPFSGDPIQEFSRTLQSRLLAGLADQITTAIYGDNPQGNGTFVVNGTTVSFNTVGNTIFLTVSDGVSVTNIALPRR